MPSETTHTSGPIYIEHEYNLMAADGYSLTGATGTDSEYWSARAKANAVHAKLCWNSHDALVMVVENLLHHFCGGGERTMTDFEVQRMAQATLKAAQEAGK